MGYATKVSLTLAIVLVFAVGSLLFTVTLVNNRTTTTNTNTPTSTTTPTRTSTNTLNVSSEVLLKSGLLLKLGINSTEVVSGRAVQVSVELFNRQPGLVNLSVSKNWTSNAFLFMPPGDSCGTQNYPIGMGIFQGYYTLANISSASPYALVRANGSTPIAVSCPVKYNIDYYVFHGLSDTASAGPNAATFSIAGAYALSGYEVIFTDSIPTRTEYHPFAQGVYTIIAATEWGNLALLHIVVQ